MRREVGCVVAVLAASTLLAFGPGALVRPVAAVAGVVALLMLSRAWEAQRIDRRMHRAGVVLAVEPDGVDGGWIATSPAGVATQGETLDEAVRAARLSFVAVQRARKETTR